MNDILNIQAPYKKVNKYKLLRFKIKPCITPALQKSISVKNSFLEKFINCNDSQTKEHIHSNNFSWQHKNLFTNIPLQETILT